MRRQNGAKPGKQHYEKLFRKGDQKACQPVVGGRRFALHSPDSKDLQAKPDQFRKIC
jgi:hypothetical protein